MWERGLGWIMGMVFKGKWGQSINQSTNLYFENEHDIQLLFVSYNHINHTQARTYTITNIFLKIEIVDQAKTSEMYLNHMGEVSTSESNLWAKASERYLNHLGEV